MKDIQILPKEVELAIKTLITQKFEQNDLQNDKTEQGKIDFIDSSPSESEQELKKKRFFKIISEEKI